MAHTAPTMYRLRFDGIAVQMFDCLEDMLDYMTEHCIDRWDATIEEWIDDRIDPANSQYKEIL